MRMAILGSGAREHAIAWALGSHDLWIVPGNAGTAQLGTNVVDVNPEDADTVAAFAQSKAIDLVVVGSESPLAKGVVDRLARAGIAAFGPTKAAAHIESSKIFALDLMRYARIPHPQSWVFSNPKAVCAFVRGYGKPVVVKADGLTRGKGVWVCETYEEAARAAALCAELYPGSIVIQELLRGQEVSVFCFTDGHDLSELVAACDYKRRDNGNKGPNTGGMGSYSWPTFWTSELSSWVAEYVMKPAIRAMVLRGTPYVGVLYAGLMICEGDVAPARVLEFNCRPGDPETQAILPSFRGDLGRVMLGCVRGTLSSETVRWEKSLSTVAVVVASPSYPGEGEDRTGRVIEIPVDFGKHGPDTLVFHGATRLSGDGKRLLFGGEGRMLTVVGLGASLSEARQRAYGRMEGMEFPHHSREDIAAL